MSKARELLDREICTQIESLSTMDPAEKQSAIDGVTKLYRLTIEEDKNEADILEKREEAARVSKVQIIGHILTGVGVGAQLWLSRSWIRQCLNFEQTGYIKSDATKWLQGFIKNIRIKF